MSDLTLHAQLRGVIHLDPDSILPNSLEIPRDVERYDNVSLIIEAEDWPVGGLKMWRGWVSYMIWEYVYLNHPPWASVM